MDFIKKIQNLPEGTRKIILWVSLSVIGLILFFLWGWYSIRAVKSIDKDNLLNSMKIPELQSNFKESMDKLGEGARELENIDDALNDAELEKALEEESLNEEEQ